MQYFQACNRETFRSVKARNYQETAAGENCLKLVAAAVYISRFGSQADSLHQWFLPAFNSQLSRTMRHRVVK